MTHPYFDATPAPRVLAHRGLPTPVQQDAQAPALSRADGFTVWENTALALAAAHAAGAVYIETDCRITSDGDVVLFHDETLLRVIGDSRAVSDVSTRELSDLMSQNGGLLTLADALDAFPTVHFNIDVKAENVAEQLGGVVASQAHRVLVTSFDDRTRHRALASALGSGATMRPATSAGQATIVRALGAAYTRLPALIRRALRDVDALQIPERHAGVRVFSPALVRAAHRMGAEVHVWTVNAPSDMKRLVELGADGIVTDRADVALKTLAQP